MTGVQTCALPIYSGKDEIVPEISPDGKALFFSSNRPVKNQKAISDQAGTSEIWAIYYISIESLNMAIESRNADCSTLMIFEFCQKLLHTKAKCSPKTFPISFATITFASLYHGQGKLAKSLFFIEVFANLKNIGD